MTAMTRTFVVEPHHLMLPPEPGKDHGPSACGQPGITVLLPKNVTCPACAALAEKEERDNPSSETVARADALNTAADETDDARDHDELHAAADVVRAGIHSRYIDRWVDELEKRFVVPAGSKSATAYGEHRYVDSPTGRCLICGLTEDDGRAEHVTVAARIR